jgi:hypothetical protein
MSSFIRSHYRISSYLPHTRQQPILEYRFMTPAPDSNSSDRINHGYIPSADVKSVRHKKTYIRQVEEGEKHIHFVAWYICECLAIG